jgi:hypothetical protein
VFRPGGEAAAKITWAGVDISRPVIDSFFPRNEELAD